MLSNSPGADMMAFEYLRDVCRIPTDRYILVGCNPTMDKFMTQNTSEDIAYITGTLESVGSRVMSNIIRRQYNHSVSEKFTEFIRAYTTNQKEADSNDPAKNIAQVLMAFCLWYNSHAKKEVLVANDIKIIVGLIRDSSIEFIGNTALYMRK